MSHAEIINARNAINQALIESEQQVAEAKAAKFQSEHTLQLLQDQEAMRQALLGLEQEQVKLKKRLTKQAAKRGLVVEVDQSLRLLEAQNKLEIAKVERLADSDQKREFEKMREQVRLSMIAHHLTEHQKVSLIIDMLDLMYKQIQEIEDNSDYSDRTKQRMIEDREEFVVSLKQDRKEREGRLSEDRLVQGGRQKGLRAGDEAAKLRGDYREKS
jgi:hypothetical protein